ncbi:hypothetical protein Dimus_009633 [Dionaea muscipula]
MERGRFKFSTAIVFLVLIYIWSLECKFATARIFLVDGLQSGSHSHYSGETPNDEDKDDNPSVEYIQRHCRQELVEISKEVGDLDLTLGILPPHLKRALLYFDEHVGFTSYLELLFGRPSGSRRHLTGKILRRSAANTASADTLDAVHSASPPPSAPAKSQKEVAILSRSGKSTDPTDIWDRPISVSSPPPPSSSVTLVTKDGSSNEHEESGPDNHFIIGAAVMGSLAFIMLVVLIYLLLRDNETDLEDGQRDERPRFNVSQASPQNSDSEEFGRATTFTNLSMQSGAHDATLPVPNKPEGCHDASYDSDSLPLPKPSAGSGTADPPPPPPPPKAPPPPPMAGPRPPPPPKVVQPPPMLAKGVGNRRGHSSSGEGSKYNSGDPDAPRTKLKPFFWDKVLASPEQSMVWNEIRAGSFQFNEEMIESLFGYSADDKKNNDRRGRSSDTSLPYIKIIDPRKAQNLSILLRALNVTTAEVRDALLEGNELPTELIQTLLKMAPTTEEELKLRLFNGDPSQLGPAERFLKVLVDIPYAFKRMESLLFMMNMKEEASGIKESFATLKAACDELRNSRLFLKLLEAVLKTGNRMNDGTFRGGAQAFKLDTLLKLSDVKGTDGKTTLLHFVVKEVIRTEGIRAARAAKDGRSISNLSLRSVDLTEDPSDQATEDYHSLGLEVVSGLSSELENVKKAAIIEADALTSAVSKLGMSLLKSKDFLNKETRQNVEDDDDECRFYHVLAYFVEQAEGEITQLLEEEKRITELVKNTVDYFHGGNSGREEGLRLFVIVRDFLIMLDKICAQMRGSASAAIAKPAASPARAPPSRESSMSTPTPSPAPAQETTEPQAVIDMRRKLFPAIVDRRANDSSSDDEISP